MRSLLITFVLLGCVLSLSWASTLQRSRGYSRDLEEDKPSWAHRHSSIWPCDVADYPEAYVLLHKVEKRLERMDDNDDDQVKSRIVEYVSDQLRQCTSDNQMDEHCVKRSIGYAMSFINHQKKHMIHMSE